MRTLTIKTKLIISLLLTGAVSILIIGWQGYSTGKESLQEASFNQLTAVRGSKARQIEAYFGQIRNQILTFSENRMVVDAMVDFKKSFHSLIDETKVTDLQLQEYEKSVNGFYRDEFYPDLLNNLGENERQPMSAYWSGMSMGREEVYLQYQYISNNENPRGEKHNLDAAADGTTYATAHEKYHPVIRSYLEKFGYYDIFLIDEKTGHIVYSVFKEVDYATSLFTGPYKNTNFAEVCKAASQATEKDFVRLIDFRNYDPSYAAPASFIASPIFDGDERVGVAIFQMPIDVINGIMTGNESWVADGLGESGETYLVGHDFKMRSISRFLIEDKEGYFEALKSVGVGDDVVNKIDKVGTSLGLQEVRTDASKAALSGNTDTNIVNDYRGVPVLSSYRPLKIEDMKWAILSEIDEEEAFRPVETLFKQIVAWGIGIILATIIVALIFTRTITTPIAAVSFRLKDISEGDGDLTQRLENTGTDEIGQVGQTFNAFIEKIQKIIRDVSSTTQDLTKSSQNLSNTSTQMSDGAGQMSRAINTVAAATEEMSASLKEVSKNTSEVSNIAANVDKQSQEASEIIEKLNSSANEIGKVVYTIKDIAEQTNLLALNATIEAASAGDAGKGFAVVANEVKELARQTAQSTEEIAKKVEDIQSNTGNAVSSVKQITGIISRLNDIARTTAASVEEQSATTNEVAGSVSQASDLAEQTSKGAGETNNNANELTQMASSLKNLVEQFKI